MHSSLKVSFLIISKERAIEIYSFLSINYPVEFIIWLEICLNLEKLNEVSTLKKKSLLFAFAYQGAGKSNKYILNKILQTELIARP